MGCCGPATAIAKRLGISRRVVTLLEGESLLNDATSLVLLRTAIAAGGAGISAVGVGLDFALAAGGGVAAGALAVLLLPAASVAVAVTGWKLP